MKELDYGKAYRYDHDEPNAFAAGQTYLPDSLLDAEFYQPTDRGMEKQIAEKLIRLRELSNNR